MRASSRGYATDVWDPEPPVTDDPLVADERVVITPHVAGLTDVTYRADLCRAGGGSGRDPRRRTA